MYNHFVDRLLRMDAGQLITPFGVRWRKALYPMIWSVVMLTARRKFVVLRREALPAQPVIFACTHNFREDAEGSVAISRRQAFMLNGSLEQIRRTFDGYTAFLAGVIPVDRRDRQSRAASKEKMLRALALGSDVILFPEGTWNKSPNLLMNPFFPGVWSIAQASGCMVVPLAAHRVGNRVYGIRGKALDIGALDREAGLGLLRDSMASLRWELMERFSQDRREAYPTGVDADRYWQNHIDGLMAEVRHYEYELERHTKFVDKRITTHEDAFSHLQRLQPDRANAFLLNPRHSG